MMIHTRAGGIYEVMGTMTGKVDAETRTIYIMDAFALPVQGTETRVNAGDEAYEFMVQWQESSKMVSAFETIFLLFVGWTLILFLIPLDWSLGECNWMVPFSSWIWLLAEWNRRQYANDQSTVSRPFCGHSGSYIFQD